MAMLDGRRVLERTTPTRLPLELWLNILEDATHVPNLMDIHPGPTSPFFATTPDDFSIDQLQGSQQVRASMSRICRAFESFLSRRPYDCILVTNANAQILSKSFTTHDALVASKPRKERAKHALSLSVRHLVVNIYPEQRSDLDKKLKKALATIAYHLPNIHTFTLSRATSPDSGLYSLNSLYKALISTSARNLLKLVFRPGAVTQFYDDSISNLLTASTKLQTLAIRVDPAETMTPSRDRCFIRFSRNSPLVNIALEDLTVQVAFPVAFWNPSSDPNASPAPHPRRLHIHHREQISPETMRMMCGVKLTYLEVVFSSSLWWKLWSPTPLRSGDVPNLTHLTLLGHPKHLAEFLFPKHGDDARTCMPSLRYLLLLLRPEPLESDGMAQDVYTRSDVETLLSKLETLDGSKLESVCFDGNFGSWLWDRMAETEEGSGVQAVVREFLNCTFTVLDWSGRPFTVPVTRVEE